MDGSGPAQFAGAPGAYEVAPEEAEIGGRRAEDASGVHAAQHDGITLDGHVDEIAFGDSERLAVFGRNDDTAEVIDASGHAPGAGRGAQGSDPARFDVTGARDCGWRPRIRLFVTTHGA